MTGRSVKSRIDRLDALRDADPDEARPAVAAALRTKTAVVVGHAAQMAASRDLVELRPEVEQAFARYLDLPGDKDVGCLAKSPLVAACDDLESLDTKLFLRGVRCVQFEPVWGGKQDRAAGIRARSLMALFRLRCPQAMSEAARLLADPEPAARAGAARAMANGSPIEGLPLLQYKALIGDDDERVIEETFGSLLALDPDGSVALLAELLKSPDETTGELAAMALGASRLELACDPLARWTRTLADRRARVGFAALAILRTTRAIEVLLAEIGTAPPERAVFAVEALAHFEYDRGLRARVQAQAKLRPAVLEAYERVFAQP